MRRIVQEGPYPRWTLPELKISFWRPLSSALAVLDHRLFGRNALGYVVVAGAVLALMNLVLAPLSWPAMSMMSRQLGETTSVRGSEFMLETGAQVSLEGMRVTVLAADAREPHGRASTSIRRSRTPRSCSCAGGRARCAGLCLRQRERGWSSRP